MPALYKDKKGLKILRG